MNTEENEELKKRELENEILSEICKKQQELINKVFCIINEKYISRKKLEELADEMNKDGSMYWARRLRELL